MKCHDFFVCDKIHNEQNFAFEIEEYRNND